MTTHTKGIENIRNIAIIAHVDHGKTTLVDCLLQQSGTLKRNEHADRVMDSNDIEKERGITITSKNTAIKWQDYRINIVDTPGHADFGGEVERVLSMVDSVLLLIDAMDGPMPHTRFVTQKAFALGLKPIVVVNKIDRDGARPHWALDQTFELFDQLGATDEQLDFPVIYTSAINGKSGLELDSVEDNMEALFAAICKHAPHPDVDIDAPFQMRINTLDYNSYVGIIGIGRIQRGSVKTNTPVKVLDREGKVRNGKVLQILGYHGLDRHEVSEATAGDIVAVTGIEKLSISETICDPQNIEALPLLTVDEPTINMTFCVNDSPFAGKEGKFLTSRQIRDRLEKEASYNVALRVEDTEDPEKFRVSGRGELHLSVLLETMRREKYELAVSQPEVIIQTNENGDKEEPYEDLVIDVESEFQGPIMENIGLRKGIMKNMETEGTRVRLEFTIPSRGLIGFQSEFRTLTAGTGIMHHTFDHYGPYIDEAIALRKNGVLISNGTGKALGYSLFNLQDRGRLIIKPNVDVYEGQVIGIHTRSNDLVVNPLKGKQLTNVRASGKDDSMQLVPAIQFSLEQALEFIQGDELLEVTPESLRVRKKLLVEHERKSASRGKKS